MKEEIKQLRVKIDGLAQLTKGLEPFGASLTGGGTNAAEIDVARTTKQIDVAKDSLYLAKAWLGKVLERLGEESPYPKDGTRKTVEDIEPTADTAVMNLQAASMPFKGEDMINWAEKLHIEKVDWLRQEIRNVIEEIPDYQSYIDRRVDEEMKECKTKEDFATLGEDLPDIYLELDLAYKYLSEARFWLGFELERIKTKDDKEG